MKVNQLLPGNVAWASPSALGMDEMGNVYLDTQAECVFSGFLRQPTQSVKIVMGDGEVEKVEMPITWTNALQEKTFNYPIRVREIKGR